MPRHTRESLYSMPETLSIGSPVDSTTIVVTPSESFSPTMQNGPKNAASSILLRIVKVSDNSIVYGPSNQNIFELVPNSGLYVARNMVAPGVDGQYSVVWDDGAGDFGAQDMIVQASPSSPPGPPSIPDEFMPCDLWLEGADILAASSAARSAGITGTQLDYFAATTSQLLYELSARRFPGICSKTIRPCKNGCACDWRMLAWYNNAVPGYGGFLWGWNNGWWWGAQGHRCGCGTVSQVKLPGYPVREVTQVTVDGNIIDSHYYRLDSRRYLTAVKYNNVLTPWPTCQDMELPDTPGLGVFTVSYNWGTPPPTLGVLAAQELGAQLALSILDQSSCTLPPGTVSVQRQAVTINRSLMSAYIMGQTTGLPNLDAFMAVYNPARLRRRSAVWSPDMQHFGRTVS